MSNKKKNRSIVRESFRIGREYPLALIMGPCVIESEKHTLEMADKLKSICGEAGVQLIFKSSYDKANRSSGNSFRGPGIVEGLRILKRVREELKLPVTTDVHTVEEAAFAGTICDIVQVPALLCRQTDLVIAAASTPAVINVKKGQFLAPWDLSNVVEKVRKAGNHDVILTERGTSFGYNNLVCDMRSIPIMQNLDAIVCFDATHAVQLPGGAGTASSGERQYIPTLAKAAVAAGADCLFIEVHDDPANAKSDKDSVLNLKDLPELIEILKKLYAIVH